MKKIILALGLLTALGSQADTLSPGDALKRAFDSDGVMRVASSKADSYALAMTREYEGEAAVYLFNNDANDAYVVVSAKEYGTAVLGYGDGKISDEIENLPPQFVWWLDQLARQLDWADKHSYMPSKSADRISRPTRKPIEPLCRTIWNQSFPYNKMCPMVGDQQSVTGCVATAMSQVMKYHDWPEKGGGENSYNWNGQVLSANFASMTFNWDQMLDDYNRYDADGNGNWTFPGTEVQHDAVALLMKAAGYSVNMSYSPSGSGAISMRIAQALGQYFHYDKSLQYLSRDCYSLSDWEEIIYNSLANDGPVIYDGQSTIGGHSFVCDGYSSDGYFHFNWGWGGISDGYFILAALDPLTQGIGGADGGFDFMQDAIVGIRPDRAGGSKWSYGMIGDGDFTFDYDKTERAIYTETMIYNSGPANMSNLMVGFIFTPVDGGEPQFFGEQVDGQLDLMYGFSSYGIDMPAVANGKYYVTAGFKPIASEKSFKAVDYPVYGVTKYEVTVSGGQISTVSPIGHEMPYVVDLEAPTKINDKEQVKLTFKITNPNDIPYMCYVRPYLIVTWDGGSDMDAAEARLQVVDIDPNSTETFTVSVEFDYADLIYPDDAEAFICLYEENQATGALTEISDMYPVFIDGLKAAMDKIISESDEMAVWYDCRGVVVAVAKPGDVPVVQKGVYIVRQGQNVEKVVL